MLAARHRARPDLGEHQRLQLRQVLGGPAVRLRRPLGHDLDPARVRELRADGVLLPGRRAGGAARVRRGRVADTEQAHAAAADRTGRHGRPHRHLPALQRRTADRARLGHGDVDRHRLRARRARAGRPEAARSRPHLPAHLLRRRRPGRPGGHRDRVQRAHRGGAVAGRPRADRRGPDPAGARLPERASLSARRYCLLGSVPQVGRGPDRGRPDLRAADLRVLGQPGVPGAGIRGVPDVPRAAHRRAGPVGAQRGAYRDLAERPAGPAVPPVDQLRHRAAVRPGQRGDRAERRVPGQGLHLAGHTRHRGRLPGRQAARHGRVRVAGHQAQSRPGAAIRRLGRGGRRRDGRRYRLHRVPADRVARAEGRHAGRGEARHPVRGGGRVGADLDRLPGW